MKKQKLNNHAFTLLELLVVIAIIGVLITVLLPNFMGFRTRGGDAKKKTELKQMKSALQMFYNDFSYYPVIGDDGALCCAANGPTGVCGSGESCTSSFTVGSEVYMKELPEDYTYSRVSLDEFVLSISLDNSADQDIVASAEKCGLATTVPVYYVCED